MSDSSLKRYAGLVGATVSVLAAATAAGVFTNKKLLARRPELHGEPLGSIRGERHTVIADDGLALYAEIEEPTVDGDRDPVTFVFVHGFALNLDCWHFQRQALRGEHRLIFFDQRSHGRSGRSQPQHSTFDQLGRDLEAVLSQLARDDPIVLVGHSLGGMTVMALAEQYPGLFGAQIRGVSLMSTSSGEINAESFGLPRLPARVLRRVASPVVATMARAPRLVESGRRASAEISYVLTRRLAFGGQVRHEIVAYVDRMLTDTPFDVVADFFPGFDTHDKREALAAMTGVCLDVVCGSLDAITPIEQSRDIASRVASATLHEISGAGHLVILERPEEVTATLRHLLERVDSGSP